METKDLADKNKIEYTDLSPMGVSSVAFTKENALLILRIIREENIPIVNVQLVLNPFKQGVFPCHYSSE